MITEDDYDVFRRAHIDDIPSLVALIEPLENEGILVKRSRELLEQEIQYFWVMLRDGLIIGCGAIYPYEAESMGEIACLTMHPDYRNNGRADKLLITLEKEALKKGLTTVFALTTHTAHWFIEHGFAKANVASLPILKQSHYNHQRRSLVFIKKLIN
jgi:amino-acid N-acetyltransferase